MVTIHFTNAEVRDSGFGLTVNGNSLEDIISKALGTKARGLNYGNERLKEFYSNSCDITVVISPNTQTTSIKTDEFECESVERMEEYLDGKYSKKATEG